MPRKKSKRVVVLVMALALLMLVTACGNSGETSKGPGGSSDGKAQTVALNGAGASFPYPLYSKWIAEYRKVAPNVTIDYQSIGSGGGIKGIIEETVDFAGSDAPMTDEQLAKAPGQIFHIPTVMGAVVITYNLEGVKTGLKLTPEVIGDIFLGKIKKWNDPAITAINPGVELPDKEITVVHRSDGSGTTNIFTDYLSSISKEWKEKVGKGTSVEWPAGIGAKGNEGVAGTVKQTPGGIGYVELAYAVQNQLPYAFIKNQAGKFVEPTLETTTAAAAGAAANMPEDMRVSIVNAPGENSYPIAGYTYLLVYKDQKDKDKGTELVKFLWWAIHDGEKFAEDLLYAPLPDNVVKLAEAKIKQINYKGEPLYK
ncbi:phosphate-binding protein [Moorella sp. E308F]|nr:MULTISPECIES: phosphate ABC transporter substrate-binding protein PstS [unclassified Moorella (in: firmicutes)]GEA14961.1 phosphate-binding protein [Moorella sp. E308F]GEA17612.1 phosphate-binding protein [Moorella sp. E306M]